MTNWKALCADLLWALENAIRIIYREDGTKHISTADPIVARARAALAQPEPEVVEPTDEELSDLWSWAAGQDQGPWPTQQHCFARAVLSRWGRPAPAPPAEGEVAELARLLRLDAELDRSDGMPQAAARFDRAADLLEQRQAAPVPLLPEGAQVIEPAKHTILVPVPVPVALSDRPWEREGWCDEDGRCWWFDPEDPHWVFDDATCRHWAAFSLPHNALPLPSGEAE